MLPIKTGVESKSESLLPEIKKLDSAIFLLPPIWVGKKIVEAIVEFLTNNFS